MKKSKFKYIYHYCCKWQLADNSMSFVDGIIESDDKIKNYEDYKKLKEEINSDTAHKMIMTSLNYLGEA